MMMIRTEEEIRRGIIILINMLKQHLIDMEPLK